MEKEIIRLENVSKTYDSSFAYAGYNHNILMSSAQLNWATYDNVVSDYFVQNGSFVKLDNITLGYTWPGLFKNQLRLRVYGAVQNPFVITKYKGLDPENYDGIDRDVYPRSITGTLGVVATF